MSRSLLAVWAASAASDRAADPPIAWLLILFGLLAIARCAFGYARNSGHGSKIELTDTSKKVVIRENEGGRRDGKEGAGGGKARCLGFSGRDGGHACGACFHSPAVAAAADQPTSTHAGGDRPPPEETIGSFAEDENPIRLDAMVAAPTIGSCVHPPTDQPTSGHAGGDRTPPKEPICYEFTANSSNINPTASRGRWGTGSPVPGRQNSNEGEKPIRLRATDAHPPPTADLHPTSGHAVGERPPPGESIYSSTDNNSNASPSCSRLEASAGSWDTEPSPPRRQNSDEDKKPFLPCVTVVAPPRGACTDVHPASDRSPTSGHEGVDQPPPDNTSNTSPLQQLEASSRGGGVITESTSPGRQNSSETEKRYRRITKAAPTLGGGFIAAALAFFVNVPTSTRTVIIYAYYSFAMIQLAAGCSIIALYLAADSTAVAQVVQVAAGLAALVLEAFILISMSPMAHAYLFLFGALLFSMSLIAGSIYYAKRVAGDIGDEAFDGG